MKTGCQVPVAPVCQLLLGYTLLKNNRKWRRVCACPCVCVHREMVQSELHLEKQQTSGAGGAGAVPGEGSSEVPGTHRLE